MKYFMLSQWVKENGRQNLQIEKIHLSDGSLIISFKTRTYLVFHYKTSSPVLYFCTKLNEHQKSGPEIWSNLNNAELYAVEIADKDRIVTFRIKLKDIYQKQTEYRLVFECMPPQANLILCINEDDNLIVKDAVNKYTYADNPQRQILSGLVYEPPRTNFNPQTDEISYPLAVKPVMDGEEVLCNSMNEYFYHYYNLILAQKALQQKKQALQSRWHRELAKAEKKLNQQQLELLEADLQQTWLTYSEIIKVNLQKMKKGDSSLEAINYYDPELKPILVPLKPEKNPRENLSFYVKKYRKAKIGKEKIQQQIDKTRSDIKQIEEILSYFDTDKWKDLETGSALPKDAIKKIKQSENLLKLAINDDWEILIGRKAKENDLISTQLGKPVDWWFHTRIYHGSHVLLRNFHKKEPPHELIELCCSLAAWFSKARHSENVPVDYTQIRYVRKPRKSAPGFVTYSNQKTVFANPIDITDARDFVDNYAN